LRRRVHEPVEIAESAKLTPVRCRATQEKRMAFS
jgi:hypothetical protein